MALLLPGQYRVKFGDIQPFEKIMYIDPIEKKIEPAFVTFVDANPKLKFQGHVLRDIVRLTVILIPEHLRTKPLKELPINHCIKLVLNFPKNESMVLVNTRPETLYATTRDELEQWIKENY